MTTATQYMESPEEGSNVMGVIKVLLARRGETASHLCLATGIKKSTLNRRRLNGKWKTHEITILARYFDVPAQVFFDGPDALFAGINKSSVSPPFSGEYEQYERQLVGAAA